MMVRPLSVTSRTISARVDGWSSVLVWGPESHICSNLWRVGHGVKWGWRGSPHPGPLPRGEGDRPGCRRLGLGLTNWGWDEDGSVLVCLPELSP